MHLSNNSIAKHSDKFYNSEIEGNMWSMKQFSEYLLVIRCIKLYLFSCSKIIRT